MSLRSNLISEVESRLLQGWLRPLCNICNMYRKRMGSLYPLIAWCVTLDGRYMICLQSWDKDFCVCCSVNLHSSFAPKSTSLQCCSAQEGENGRGGESVFSVMVSSRHLQSCHKPLRLGSWFKLCYLQHDQACSPVPSTCQQSNGYSRLSCRILNIQIV